VIEAVTNDFRCFILAGDSITMDLHEDLAWSISHAWGGGKVVIITNKQLTRLEGEPLILPVVHDIENRFLAPVMEILILQLFMVRMAAENNVPPGVFRYSSKITHDG
jgi:fructoselysine-6-P-deglycase FrlB-like protein